MKLNDPPIVLRFILPACIGLLLVSCVNNNVAGGNSSETTNVAIVTPDGEPASSAKVKIIDAGNWSLNVASRQSPIADSAEADDHGVVTLKNLPAATLNLQIDHPDGGILIRNFTTGDTDTQETITLQKYSSVRGSCLVKQGRAESVTLEGTSYESVINDDKSFVIQAASPGLYPLLIKSGSGEIAIANLLNLRAGQSTNAGTLSADFADLLVDDFKDGDYYSILWPMTNGFWYGMVDTLDGGTSQMTLSIGPDSDGLNAIMANIVLNYRPQMAWAGFGVAIGRLHSEWDLGAIDGISFEARGSGTIRVSLESGIIDSITPWPHFGYVITLDSTWRRYDIPVDSLSLIVNSKNYEMGVTLPQAIKRICRLEFEAESIYHNLPVENVSIKVRNVYLKGISASELLIQMKNYR
ncbi:MAG TPA: hypothetical protein VHO70_21095 [Chitinispirillaceae bacterium]|nr:hypothetical protein [Chitinispirillaceae bacterium]